MTHSTVSLKSPLMNKVVILSSFLIFFSFILIVTYAPATFANTETSSAVGTMQLNQDLFEVSTGSSFITNWFLVTEKVSVPIGVELKEQNTV